MFTQNFVVTGKRHLTISGCRDWYQRLNAGLENPDRAVVFDMSKVEKIDTASLQLLTAFVFKARANGVSLTWPEPSSHFLAVVRCLNLNAALGCEV